MDRALLGRAVTALGGIEATAKLLDMQPRSLQRMLKEGGTPIPDLRFELAEHAYAKASEVTKLAEELRNASP